MVMEQIASFFEICARVIDVFGLSLLVLGVLYEARVRLGDVGESQYVNDQRQVEEWRREAALLVSDGDLLQANALRAQAEDLNSAATNLNVLNVISSSLISKCDP